MFPFFCLLFTIVLIIWDARNLWWVFLVISMWINPDVRLGPMTLLNELYIFIFLYTLYKCIYNKRIILYPKYVEKRLKILISYIISINLLFIVLSTGPLVDNIIAIKSSFAAWFLYLSLLYIPARVEKTKLIDVSLLLVTLYGLYCYITTSNPYAEMISSYLSDDVDIISRVEFSMNDQRGALKGRLTGTSLYTIQYGIMMLIMVYVLLYRYKNKMNVYFFSLLFALSFLNIYLTGSRGPLLALIIGLFTYYSRILSPKKQISILFLLVTFYILFNDFFNTYVGGLAQDEVGGSTTEGRGLQFYGAMLEVTNSMQSLLFGKGPYFIGDYINKYGPHPMAIYFESAHVSGIVTYGILGLVFVFVGTIYMLWYTTLKLYQKKYISKNTFYLLSSMVLSFFIYNIAVGNSYGVLFMFVYFLILLSDVTKKSLSIEKNIHPQK